MLEGRRDGKQKETQRERETEREREKKLGAAETASHVGDMARYSIPGRSAEFRRV
jgi:hypothetical protein